MSEKEKIEIKRECLNQAVKVHSTVYNGNPVETTKNILAMAKEFLGFILDQSEAES